MFRVPPYEGSQLASLGPIDPPVNVVPPVITSSGDISAPVNGDILTVSDNGTWTNSPTGYTYQWFRDNETNPIGGATDITYTVNGDSLADGGHALGCRVTATNGAGSTPVNSNLTGTVISN